MGRHKRQQFINKKNAVTFHLVHRSQRDPLQADEDSSKFVLQEAVNLNEKKANDDKRKEEQRNLGVFFEDDYDYTQHLREVQNENVVWQVGASGDGGADGGRKQDVMVQSVVYGDSSKVAKIQLPAEIFPSAKEDDVGLLNRAAPISGPRLDLDPDVVAAMDEDFDMDDPDNILEDDFVVKAQDTTPLEGEDGMDDSDADHGGDDVSSGGEYEREDFDDEEEETKTRFTNYSLSSSVIRRSEGLTLLDDRFEKIFEEYDDMELGAIDHDEIEGFVLDNSEILKQVLTEFEDSQKRLVLEKAEGDLGNQRDGQSGDEDSSDDEEVEDRVRVEEKKKEKWDCESILSTYSNLYNHPKVIDDRPIREKADRMQDGTIRLSAKTGMPLGVLPISGLTKKQLERQELEEYRLPLVVTQRKKGQKEDTDERKERKLAIRTERKMRRVEKKVNKEAFKEEEKFQKKVMMNLRSNMQGVKVT